MIGCWHLTCPVCGAAMGDAELHQKFHDALRGLARLMAPDLSDEEWDASVAAAAAEMFPQPPPR